MLTIRQAQYELLAAAQYEAACARLGATLARHWPEDCARLGPAGVRAWIDGAWRACAPRGIVHEADVAGYLNAMAALGEGFERDPRYAWAPRVLDDPTLRPAARVARLCALVEAALEAADAAAAATEVGTVTP